MHQFVLVLFFCHETQDISKVLSVANLGSIYMGLDPFGTSKKLVWISLVFTWGLVDLVQIGSAIWYQMGPLMKVIRTVPVSNCSHVNTVGLILNGSEHIQFC